MNDKNIGKNIQILRSSCGMTQAELAENTGVSTDCIKKVEAGFDPLSLPLLMKMCVALDTTPNDVLAGEYPSDGPEADSLLLATGQDDWENLYKDVKEEDAILLKYIYHFMTNRKQK